MASTTGIPRLGLVLPKRLARHAVLRNLIRRQAREAFRLRAVQLPSLDFVLRLTRSMKDLTGTKVDQKQRFRREIDYLLDQALLVATPGNPGTDGHGA